jgi:hypothetical protein
MPASYVIDKERGLVISKGTGRFTPEDGFAHQNALAADENFDNTFNQLLDFSEVTEVVLNTDSIRQLAERHVFSEHSRRAFLVNSNLVIGLSRMFAAYREIAGGKEQMRIFEDWDEAMHWLLGE